MKVWKWITRAMVGDMNAGGYLLNRSAEAAIPQGLKPSSRLGEKPELKLRPPILLFMR